MSGPSSMRTPLARVRSLGSSHSGTRDFWRQRLTAVAMTLLIVPVIVVVMMLRGSNQAGAAQTLGQIPIAIILLLFILSFACIVWLKARRQLLVPINITRSDVRRP